MDATLESASASKRYQVDNDWLKLPDTWPPLVDVSGIAIDAMDHVYLFTRGEHPVVVLDRDGHYVRSFGEGRFRVPHGIQVTPRQELLLTDLNSHAVYKYTLDGRHLMTIGTPDKPSPYLSGLPFNRPTHTAVTPDGDILVSDGYGNGRVHRYSSDGVYITSWGNGTGSDPGQFNVVHNICCDRDGWVYIADRENHRIQIFDVDGRYQRQINNLHRPCGLFVPNASNPAIYVAEFGAPLPVNRRYLNLGPRISVLDCQGALLSRIGGVKPGLAEDEFIAPHSIAIDSRGNLYVGEVSTAMWHESFPESTAPAGVKAFRRYRCAA